MLGFLTANREGETRDDDDDDDDHMQEQASYQSYQRANNESRLMDPTDMGLHNCNTVDSSEFLPTPPWGVRRRVCSGWGMYL
jgi:hypothetical protein